MRGTGSVASPHRPGLLTHAVAGLHAGIVGVFWMWGCFAVAAFWSGQSVWTAPNLFSTAFYGEDAYQGEFLSTTWAGLALIVFIYGLLGVIWGCLWKDKRKPLLRFFGAVTGLVTYYLLFNLIWPHVDATIPLYAPERQLQVAHVLWGAALAGSPGYSVRITGAMNPPPSVQVSMPGLPGNQDDAESTTGELIL